MGYLDLNQGPISYEPTALTTELYPHVVNRYEYISSAESYILYLTTIMEAKIKKYTPVVTHYVKSLQDVRVAGQLLFVIIVLLISWSGVKAIQTNYGLQKQISALQEQNDVQTLKNKNLKLQNDYYNSSQYLELSARQNFGLALPGETELIVPQQVALADTVDVPAPSTKQAALPQQSSFEKNVTAWLDFFLHHQN